MEIPNIDNDPVKARIERPGVYVEIQISPTSGVDLGEMLRLVEGALYGVGFYLGGHLDIVEEEENEE